MSAARLGKLAVALGGLSAMLVLYTVHASMPANAMKLPLEDDLQSLAWAPESWKFFTKNPQEAELVPWVREEGAWRSAAVVGASPRYLFGVNRGGRALGVESGLLLSSVPKSAMTACEDEPAACLGRMRRAVKTENATPGAALCGDVALVMQKPVPWGWAVSGKRIVMPSKIVRLEVQCSS